MLAATRSFTPLLLLGVVVLLLAATAHAQIKIDNFMTPFPPNPDLPVSGAELIFVGTFCDGSGCPPQLLVTHATQDQCSQSGLSGVIGGRRSARIVRVGTTGKANVSAFDGYLCVDHGPSSKSQTYIDYGVDADMNADLVAGGATALEITATGDMYAGPRPVPLTITLTSRRGTPQQATASATLNLIDDAKYTYPFSGFAGVDFSDVDAISLYFDASAVSAVDFCVYDFQTNGTPVSVAPSTWGRVKTLYR